MKSAGHQGSLLYDEKQVWIHMQTYINTFTCTPKKDPRKEEMAQCSLLHIQNLKTLQGYKNILCRRLAKEKSYSNFFELNSPLFKWALPSSKYNVFDLPLCCLKEHLSLENKN